MGPDASGLNSRAAIGASPTTTHRGLEVSGVYKQDWRDFCEWPQTVRPGRSRYSAQMRLTIRRLLALGACLLSLGAWAQPCQELPPPRSVADGQGCLAVVPVSEAPGERRVLVVMLHGDSTGTLENRHIERWTGIGQSLSAAGRVVLFLVRPGYRSPAGHSSGWANPRDDDYTARNVDRVAQALRQLRQSYQAQKLVLVGHSGGAATSALVLGRHPDIADGALLLGCPCDVPPWREHRNSQRGGGSPWSNSLNPLDAVAGLRTGVPIWVATGAQDDNTLPVFGQRWAEAAAARGAQARFEPVPGRDHASIQRWPEIAQRVNQLLESLP